jgi:hypothetical protein
MSVTGQTPNVITFSCATTAKITTFPVAYFISNVQDKACSVLAWTHYFFLSRTQLYLTNELCIIRRIQYSNDKRSYAYYDLKNKQTVGTPSILDTQSQLSSKSWASRSFCFLTVLVKPSGHYMYRTVVTICTASFTFNSARSAHTLYLCVSCGSQNKQRLFPYTTLTDWFV